VGLYDLMAAEAAGRRLRPCLLRDFYRALSRDDRADFRRALADPAISQEAFL